MNNFDYLERKQRDKANRYILVFLATLSMCRISLGIILNKNIDYENKLTKLLLLTQFLNWSIFWGMKKISKYVEKLRWMKHLGLGFSIVLLCNALVIISHFRNEVNNFERGLLQVFPVVIFLHFGMFSIRKVGITCICQLLYMIFFVLSYPFETNTQILTSVGRLSLGFSYVIFSIYNNQSENKISYELRQAMIKKEAMYRQFMNSIKDHVYIISLNQGPIFQNRASKAKGVLNNENWIQYFGKFITLSDPTKSLINHIRGLADQVSDYHNMDDIDLDKEFRFHDIETKEWRLFSINIIGGQLFEEKHAVAIIIKDITEKQKYEEERIGDKYKTMIFNSLSHEIRTPLNAIIGMLQIMKDKVDDPAINEHINIAHSNSFFLQNQLNDFLDFGQIMAKAFKLHFSPFSIRELFAQLITAITPLIHQKNIKIREEIDSRVPLRIHSDERRITQILVNFLSNSVKYTRKGVITLICKYIKGGILLGVSDTGRGMNKEQIKSLFKVQSGIAITEQEKNKFSLSGIGLTIAHLMVTELHSRIELKSKEGEGSTFYFNLQDINTGEEFDLTNLQIPNEFPPHLRRVHSLTDDYSLLHVPLNINTQKFILIVDDVATNRFVLRGLLKKFHSTIYMEEAENGLRALQRVARALEQNIRNILVFMDLDMPVMDGIRAISEIRKLPHGDIVAILVVTAFASEAERIKCENAGIQEFLHKPIDQHLAIKSVENYLYKT